MRSAARFPVGALLLLCTLHAVADGVRPLAMPVRLVTVWSSEHHVDEALAFASADDCGDLVEAGPVGPQAQVETVRHPLSVWTSLPPPGA
ncbi:MAG: hypothetical protein VYC41_06075 [Planctomycetota bacterium]|nr:hypothetical protein [Planctomycetota bacterium]